MKRMSTRTRYVIKAGATKPLPSRLDIAVAGTRLVRKASDLGKTLWHNPTGRPITLDVREGFDVMVSPA